MTALLITAKAIHAMFEKSMAALAIVFPWLAPLAALVALLGGIEANYTSLVNAINGLAAHLATMPAAHWLGQANRIVPITEILAMILALLGLRISALLVRFIKSWIPTVN